jgi:hypothetical protein
VGVNSSVGESIGSAAVELPPDDLSEIDAASSKIVIKGARCPEIIFARR